MLCKGEGNCRNGKSHKTLDSCPYFKSSKLEKDKALSEKDDFIFQEQREFSIKFKQLNFKIIDLEKKLEDENKTTESSFNELKAKHLIDLFKSNEKTKEKERMISGLEKKITEDENLIIILSNQTSNKTN